MMRKHSSMSSYGISGNVRYESARSGSWRRSWKLRVERWSIATVGPLSITMFRVKARGAVVRSLLTVEDDGID